VWLWAADGKWTPQFTPTDERAYATAEPVAGVVDPQTHRLDSAGTYFHGGRRAVWRITPGSVFRYQTNAGGGWGDPSARPADQVLRDVRDEYLSIQAAREVYGVVVEGDPVSDPEGLRIDEQATAALRAAARRDDHRREEPQA
jgi:N-methylhydantoinase B